MITIKATITCNYDLSKNEEYKVLKCADEHGLSLEEAIEKLQKDEIIDILFNEPYEERVEKISEATFEKDEKDCE
ncbi:hypothetical protein [Clostridium sp.]|uniref:hypothetical protein n=1 Tax=Clostridium sp. TaxID=1506 RepID=UPI00261EFEA0|nr:hypothetical protein [Clostridium sp.]